MLLPGLGPIAVDVAQLAVEMLDQSVEPAVLAESVPLSNFVCQALFMLIMLEPGAAQSVADLTLVFPLRADTNNHEVPSTTSTATAPIELFWPEVGGRGGPWRASLNTRRLR